MRITLVKKIMSELIKIISSFFMIILITNNAFGAHTCTLSTIANVAFGNINTYSGDSPATGTVRVSCTKTGGGGAEVANYTLSFSAGNSGDINNRVLKSGTNNLSYNLYDANSYTNILGNGTTGVTLPGSLNLNNGQPTKSADHSIFGKIPMQPSAVPGSYSELSNITVTLTY